MPRLSAFQIQRQLIPYLHAALSFYLHNSQAKLASYWPKSPFFLAQVVKKHAMRPETVCIGQFPKKKLFHSLLKILRILQIQYRLASVIPSFCISNFEGEHIGVGDDLGEFLHQRQEPVLWHVGDEVVEHTALPKQRVSAGFACVGLQEPIHAEAFANSSQQSQHRGCERADQQQPVASRRITDAGSGQSHTKPEVLGVTECRLDRPALGIVVALLNFEWVMRHWD